MKLVPISNGKFAKVDDEDFELVNKFHWHMDGAGYARTNVWRNNKKDSAPRMHRLILGNVDTKLHIDHINGDKLDNRKSNLRVLTCSQNAMNRGPQTNNSSGYKGVVYDRSRNKWKAEIGVNKKRIHLGRFDSAEEAALAYNQASFKYHGEFGFINEIAK
jgi:hypothetical protein